MAVVQPQQFTADTAQRLVWVLNLDPEREYKEEFRGTMITIPPMLKKIPKRVEDGGNLMPWLAARKFLGQMVETSQKAPDGTVIQMGKPLRTVELTDEERDGIENPKELLKQAKEEEAAAERTCMLCAEPKTFASKKGLELHLAKDHSNRKPIES